MWGLIITATVVGVCFLFGLFLEKTDYAWRSLWSSRVLQQGERLCEDADADVENEEQNADADNEEEQNVGGDEAPETTIQSGSSFVWIPQRNDDETAPPRCTHTGFLLSTCRCTRCEKRKRDQRRLRTAEMLGPSRYKTRTIALGISDHP